MSDVMGAKSLFNSIKVIVDNYLANRKVTTFMVGTYNGSAIVINERLPLPMEMITGNLKSKLSAGDRVRLLRNDGGNEYMILEIIDKPYLLEVDYHG